MAMTFNKKDDGSYCLDVTGYVCPHPQIYTKKALEKLNSGEFLELIFDNPSSSESVLSTQSLPQVMLQKLSFVSMSGTFSA